MCYRNDYHYYWFFYKSWLWSFSIFTNFWNAVIRFFDFITNSIMMPIAALIICYVTVRYVGLDNISKEMKQCGHQFKMEKVFRFMIQYACPIFVIIILISSIANVFGFIHI